MTVIPPVRLYFPGNGTVEFNEFIRMMARRAAQLEEEATSAPAAAPLGHCDREETEIRQAFRVFDIDGDGLIDEDCHFPGKNEQ